MRKLEFRFLEWEFFDPKKFAEEEIGMYAMYTLMILMSGWMAFMIGWGVFALTAVVLPEIAAAIIGGIPVAIVAAAPFGQKFYALGGMDDNITHSRTYSYYSPGPTSKSIMRDYLDLSKEDRALLPADIMDTMRQDLKPEDRRKVNKEVTSVIFEIKARNAEKAKMDKELARQHIPIDSIMLQLEAAREQAQIERQAVTEVRKELA